MPGQWGNIFWVKTRIEIIQLWQDNNTYYNQEFRGNRSIWEELCVLGKGFLWQWSCWYVKYIPGIKFFKIDSF